MRIIILMAASAAALTLVACQRDAAVHEQEAEAAADSGADAVARARSTASAAPPETIAADPAPRDQALATGAPGGGVSDETRALAKEKAEATNLHPQTRD